tara:strand:+ start:215 stop:436 length:222 start_codon:yes stop_codon:yes gene_type:complete
MEKLDLHNISHEKANILIEEFILINIDKLPIKIITGNSIDMQKILMDYSKKLNINISPQNHKNLGSYVITEKF